MPRIIKEDTPQEAAPPRRMNFLDRARPASLASVPPEVEGYFASHNMAVTLIHSDPRNLAQESVYGRFPVSLDDINDESVKMVARRSFDSPDRSFGQLRRGDTILVAQSIDERDAWRIESQKANDALDRYFEVNDQPEFDALTGPGAGFVKVRPKDVSRVSDHVFGGPDLASQVRHEQEAAAERASKP